MAKSIIDVQVDSGSFDAFKAEFDKYKAALAEMPAAWEAIGSKIDSASDEAKVHAEAVTKATAGAQAIDKSLSDIADNWNKVNVTVNSTYGDDVIKRANKLEQSSFKTRGWMSDAAKYSKSLAGRVKDTTESLLKWSGIVGVFSGLAGAGSLFGINRMAANASNLRHESMGLGVTSGQYQAAGINFGKVVDNPSALMGSIQNAQYDVSKRWAFNAMGVNPNNSNLTQLTGDMLKAAKRTFASSGSTLQGAEAHGLTQFFSLNDLVRLKNMSDAEIDAMTKRAEADSKQLALNDRTLRSWQDFNQQMSRSGTQIENTFITGLLPLAKPLENLSDAFSKAVAVFLKSPLIGEGLEKLANGLDMFAKYLESPEFPKDVESFMKTLKDLATGVESIVKGIVKIGQWFNGGNDSGVPVTDSVTIGGVNIPRPEMAKSDPSAQVGSSGLDKRSWLSGPADWWHDHIYADYKGQKDYDEWRKLPVAERNNNPGNLRSSRFASSTADGFAAFKSTEEGLRAMAWQLQRYGSGEAFGKKVDTVKDIISHYAPKDDKNDTDTYVKTVVSRMGGITENTRLNLNDPAILSQLISAMTKMENNRSNFSPSQVKVTITNNTGGNANVATMQLAH